MRHILPFYIVLACIMLCVASCKKKECSGSTGIFVRVLDSSNNQSLPLFPPFYPALDSIITRSSSGSIIPPDSNSRFPIDGNYPLIDDSYRPVLDGNMETIRFYAYKNGKTVIDTPFVVSADECHVYKISGPEYINLP